MSKIKIPSNKCNYQSEIMIDNTDTYKNTELEQSINYANDDNNVCLGLQTAHNLFSGVESSGSSYEYTVHFPTNIINTIHTIYAGNEYFEPCYGINNIDKLDPIYIFLCVICIVIICLIYVQKQELL